MKKLTREQMKNVMGGWAMAEGCAATACCNEGGSISCSGASGCQSIEGTNISVVNCTNSDGTTTTQSCN